MKCCIGESGKERLYYDLNGYNCSNELEMVRTQYNLERRRCPSVLLAEDEHIANDTMVSFDNNSSGCFWDSPATDIFPQCPFTKIPKSHGQDKQEHKQHQHHAKSMILQPGGDRVLERSASQTSGGGKMGRPIAQANIQLELPEFDPKNLPEWAEEFAEFLLLTGQSHVDVATKCSLLKRSCKKKFLQK